MKKLKMARGVTPTFEEGCNKYLENCRQRNLREGTIGDIIDRVIRSSINTSTPKCLLRTSTKALTRTTFCISNQLLIMTSVSILICEI